MSTLTLVDFKDPTRLTLWVKWLSYFCIFASIFALITGYWEYDFYQKLMSDFFLDEDIASAAEDLKDKWVGTSGIFQMTVIFLLIAFFMWVHRLNSNTHALGVEGMKYTPGWSVGWFFVPIANIWKPYQVLKELWKSNLFPQDMMPDGKPKNAQFIGWFWVLMIISSGLGKLVFKRSFTATELPQLISLNKLTLVSDFLDIPSLILTIILVERIYKVQMVKFASQARDYQKLISELPLHEKESQKWTQSIWVRRCLVTLLVVMISMMIIALGLIWMAPLLD